MSLDWIDPELARLEELHLRRSLRRVQTPTGPWIELAGLALMVVAWAPSFMTVRAFAK